MTDEQKKLEQKAGDFPNKIGAHCLECGTAKTFYFLATQKDSGKDSALYTCASCRHTFDYEEIIGK